MAIPCPYPGISEEDKDETEGRTIGIFNRLLT